MLGVANLIKNSQLKRHAVALHGSLTVEGHMDTVVAALHGDFDPFQHTIPYF